MRLWTAEVHQRCRCIGNRSTTTAATATTAATDRGRYRVRAARVGRFLLFSVASHRQTHLSPAHVPYSRTETHFCPHRTSPFFFGAATRLPVRLRSVRFLGVESLLLAPNVVRAIFFFFLPPLRALCFTRVHPQHFFPRHKIYSFQKKSLYVCAHTHTHTHTRRRRTLAPSFFVLLRAVFQR